MSSGVNSPLTDVDGMSGGRCRLTTLGELRLLGPDGAERLSGRRKELALAAFLARRSPRAVPRDELASLLWGERDGAKARQSLRHALLQLRRALGDAIEVTPDYARIDATLLEVDATAFEHEIANGRPQDAVARWRGDFLARLEDAGGDSFRAWLEAEREGLRHRLASTLDRLIRDALNRRDSGKAVAWGERWVVALPLDETAHRRLIETLTAAGRPDEALARHANFMVRLRKELDEDPSPSFQALREALTRAVAQRQPSGPGSIAILTPDLVGRDATLAELMAAWDEARSGRTSAVFLAGDEGLGKSRVCQEFVRWVKSRVPDAHVFSARACASDRDGAWSTVRSLLASLGDARGLLGASPAALEVVARVVPSVARARAERGMVVAAPPNDDAVTVAVEIAAISEVLEAVASEVPVLIVLDDAPLADSITQQALAALITRAPPGRMLVATGHPAALSASLLAEELRHNRSVRRIRLQPLVLRDTEAVVRSMIALDPDDCAFLAERLHNDSAGNPFYVAELVFALADDGTLVLGEDGHWHVERAVVERRLPLPAGVREAVKGRLATLGDDERFCAEAAAVIDGPVNRSLLERMTELPPERVTVALTRLLARRLFRETSTPASELPAYEFAHETVRRITHDLLEDGRRRALTARLGSARLAAQAESSRVPSPDNRKWSQARSRSRLAIAGAAAAIASAILLLATRQSSRVAGAAMKGDGARSVAVLPFVNLSSDSGNEYFSDGITEELINALARVRGLHVPARTSSFAFKGKALSITEIGQQLKVRAVLEGSVRRSGKQLRVTAQLVDVATGYELWSEVYDRHEADILQVQEEIAQAISAKLRGALLTDSSDWRGHEQTLKPEAYDLYLRGRYFWNQRTEASLNKSIAYFERALALDSNYAMAYAGLADSYAILGANGYRPLSEVLPNAESTANKALGLNGSIAKVHATRALIRWLEWQWSAAGEEFRQSIALDSAYVPARLWYALYLSGKGRAGEAIREITRARELDPLSLIINTEVGRVLELAHRDTPAVEAYTRALEIDSTYELANSLLAEIAFRTRRFDMAERAVARLVRSNRPSSVAELRAYGYAIHGDTSATRQALGEIDRLRTSRYVSPYSVACIYAALNDSPRALEWLQRAYTAHSSEMTALAVDPRLDALRADPRFLGLVHRMGLDE